MPNDDRCDPGPVAPGPPGGARPTTATWNKTVVTDAAIVEQHRPAGADAPNARVGPPTSANSCEGSMKNQTALLMLGLATLASVAPGQATHAVHGVPSAPSADTTADTVNTVTVQNDRKVPVTVYMEYGEFDRRLGVVPGLQTKTLPLPATLVRGRESVRLFAHPDGDADDLATQEIQLRPPGRVAMLIPPRGGLGQTPADTMSAVIPPEELADATITVDNPRTVPVTVFAEQGPFDVRLGRVPAKGRVTVRFPKSVELGGESIQVFVHPEGSEDLASETLQIRKGEHLGLRVPAR